MQCSKHNMYTLVLIWPDTFYIRMSHLNLTTMCSLGPAASVPKEFLGTKDCDMDRKELINRLGIFALAYEPVATLAVS